MSESISATFVITRELRAALDAWAAEDDRSASYILRDILKREAKRRAGQGQADPLKMRPTWPQGAKAVRDE